MSRREAIRTAITEVRSNDLYDPDYNLPNFAALMGAEIMEQCPQYAN